MAECKTMPATLLEALLSVGLVNDAGEEYPNVMYITAGVNDVSAIACGENISDPEALIVVKYFTVDTNGKLAIKLQ